MSNTTPYIYTDIHTHHPAKEGVRSVRNYSLMDRVDSFEHLHSIAIHPYDATEDSFALLNHLLDSNPIAIGETGLDYRCNADKNIQRRLFEAHTEIALSNRLPLMIHSVHSIEDTLSILNRVDIPVIIHGFIGHPQSAKRFINRGFYLSFGPRTIRSPKSLESLINTPPSQLFIESDDDDFPIDKLYAIFAEHLKISTQELIKITNSNFNRIFDQ